MPEHNLKSERLRKGDLLMDLVANEFSHVGIHVRNLDESLKFYHEELGLEVISKWVADDPSTLEVVNLPNAALNMALLRLPGTNAYMEIIEYQNVERNPIDTFQANPG